jgi:hypothetical protein
MIGDVSWDPKEDDNGLVSIQSSLDERLHFVNREKRV